MGIEEYRASVRERNRQAILNAALHIFLEQGYDRTTLEQVARAASVSTATLYKRFPSKAELFGAIMEQAWATDTLDLDAALANDTLDAALRHIGMSYTRLLRNPIMLPLFRLIIAEAPRFPELGSELYRRGKEPFLTVLHVYFERQTNAGALQIDDIPLATRQFLGMINDVIFWPRLLIPELNVDDAEVERVVVGAVATFLARYGFPGNDGVS
jgi:TetR/AcrR family transcriptional regulator, regulator of autoinduction and epiphytic fitness